MNEEYRFLETIANFLEQGYLIQDVLNMCKYIYNNDLIEKLNLKLNAGKSLDEAILECDFNKTFKEYFKFFRIKNNLSIAIIQSVDICKAKDNTFMKLKKELTYPALLIIFLMMFSLFIVYALLPSIMQLFSEFAIEPTLITSFMFMLFKIVPILIISLLIIFISLCFMTVYAINKQYFQLIDFFINHSFIIKNIIQKYYSIKFALYYNELLVSGYDTTDIIIMLYHQIDDSDIKMLIYEIYTQILKGESLAEIISNFNYFEPLFIASFKILIHDNQTNKSLNNYLKISLDTLHFKIAKVIKIIIPVVYGFTATFVILVYVSIIIPMMSVISNL
ncbi:type II secretion system F family protein [Thomasclavelia sp.]|uniref:type II secretion system F family protein n=1 Tax=Thomasclavelia sp. TaxID=3025757 RepID=UPI002618A2B5|nr:type II secretion system F family protein [Thomasclavelia sp.]